MLLPSHLAQELELIAAEATRGEPAGPHLCRRLERDVTALLHRQYPGVRVVADLQGSGIAVSILVPRRGKPVERIVFHVAHAGPGGGPSKRFKL